MKFCLAAILIFPLLVYSKSPGAPTGTTDKLAYYLNIYIQADGSTSSTAEVTTFIDKLAVKRSQANNDHDFLAYMFDKTHRRFLRSYSDYVSFGQTLTKGRYNCLTGTALYALLLDRFNFEHEIIETNYHIFLLVTTDKGKVLLEATDPENGFVDDQKKIEERINQYRQNRISSGDNSKKYYQYDTELYRTVNLDEMLGLIHYNLSVVAYNKHDLVKAITHLGKAMELYHSPRIEEFSRIIMLTVKESKLDAAVRQKCLDGIQALTRRQSNLLVRN